MNFRWLSRFSPEPFAAILLGVAAFFFITGGRILWPTNTSWLMWGDPAQHWMGWQYFRYTPLFQWPMGANPDLGMEISSSIVFTDSIPLLAFIFKLLNPLLPDTFQYTGLWILICFSLQSFFAWKLLSLFTKDQWLPLIGCVFFIIAPIGLWRVGGHYALFGQWVLLAGLYLYFAEKFSIFRWTGLLAATALIHAYLLAMVLVIWSADLIQRYWLKQKGIVKTLSYFIAGCITIAIMMWAAGYFMVGKGVANVGSHGFGFVRMNLLALIDSKDIYSKLLPALPFSLNAWGDFDGFNFLGSGMLGLGFIAGYLLLRNVKNISETIPQTRLMPLLMMSIGLFLYAISNRIVIGPYEIFSYPLPPVTEQLTYAFRSSGRFFWPVYYVIYLAIFYLLFTRLKRSVAMALCAMMLFVQLIDSADAWRKIRADIMQSVTWKSPILSPVWSDMAHRYKKIIVVPPEPNDFMDTGILLFAATNQMAINTVFCARVNQDKLNQAKAHIAASMANNELNSDSLYVFKDDALWKTAASRVAPSDVAGVLDGYRIIAPKLRECKTCNISAIAGISAGD